VVLADQAAEDLLAFDPGGDVDGRAGSPSWTGRNRATETPARAYGQDDYGWVGWTEDGYRYDHAFCTSTLHNQITAYEYLHEPRHSRLSDHSALSVLLSVTVLPGGTRPVPDYRCNGPPLRYSSRSWTTHGTASARS
jgi:hypothetical protein